MKNDWRGLRLLLPLFVLALAGLVFVLWEGHKTVGRAEVAVLVQAGFHSAPPPIDGDFYSARIPVPNNWLASVYTRFLVRKDAWEAWRKTIQRPSVMQHSNIPNPWRGETAPKGLTWWQARDVAEGNLLASDVSSVFLTWSDAPGDPGAFQIYAHMYVSNKPWEARWRELLERFGWKSTIHSAE